jgi:hypothetical protein
MDTNTSVPASQANPTAIRAEAIAQLNDDMRKKPFGAGKRAVVTRAVNHQGPAFIKQAMAMVAAYDDFRMGQNIHPERDYGTFDLDGQKMLFKIDYFDVDGLYASEDPSDPAQTLRVMTVMFASEY